MMVSIIFVSKQRCIPSGRPVRLVIALVGGILEYGCLGTHTVLAAVLGAAIERCWGHICDLANMGTEKLSNA